MKAKKAAVAAAAPTAAAPTAAAPTAAAPTAAAPTAASTATATPPPIPGAASTTTPPTTPATVPSPQTAKKTIKKIAIIVAVLVFLFVMAIISLFKGWDVSLFKACDSSKPKTATMTTAVPDRTVALQKQNYVLQQQNENLQRQIAATNAAKQVTPPVVTQPMQNPAVAQVISQVSGGNNDVVLSLWTGKPAIIHELKSMGNGSQGQMRGHHQVQGAQADSDAKEKEQKVKDRIDFLKSRIDENAFQLTNLEHIMTTSDTRNPVVKSDRRALAKKLAEAIARDQDNVEKAMVELQYFR